jgi:hypothetical protein
MAQPGAFQLGPALTFEAPAAQSEVLARILNEELSRAELPAVRVQSMEGTTRFALAHRSAADEPDLAADDSRVGSYVLEVRTNVVLCAASTPSGLLYGLQTLCQLIRANRHGAALPGLRIGDWPSLPWRCFQDDMTRGPSSTLETLKFEAALGAYLKFNLMTYYMEYQFAFKKHPSIGPPDGSLTPEDLAALVVFAQPLHLDILGNQQSFGHFGHILKHAEYASLQETPDVLSPAREEAYGLLDDLYAEVCPLLPFPWFNVCCDETWGLGTGPSKELAQKIGVGGVYVQHIRRVHDLVQKHKKRMLMWGDIILQHPDHLPSIPRDTIMLTWGYDARPSFEDQIIPFARSGYEFLVCPGVNNWSRILPDFGVAMTNIQHFVRDGVKHDALGMLNTDWEDDGEAINAVKWHADAWAAECAWNAAVTPPEIFNRRVGAVLFGEQGDHFGRAVGLLAQTHRLPGMQGMLNPRFWRNDFSPQTSPAPIQSSASNLLAMVRPALAHLEACRQEAVANQHVLDAYLFGARRMERMGRRMLEGLEAAQLYEQAWATASGQGDSGQIEPATAAPGVVPRPQATDVLSLLGRVETLVRQNRDAHQALGQQFAALWLSESKPYALDWTMKRYTNAVLWYDDLLQKLAGARAAAKAKQPLPQPDQVGLAVPGMFARKTRPQTVLNTPLAPATSWAEPSATHRLGLVIRAGSVDRFELPIELDLALPAELAAKPVRAFQWPAAGAAQEILAQLDPSPQAGKTRLALFLPGPIARGTEATVHVYLGLDKAPDPLPTSVSTSAGPNQMKWIENDKVRLLLGPEGAHLYRWEVKAAGGRDLTQPGETDWAGFCDMGTHRTILYRLECQAQGPALVRYQCTDPSGQTKVISLYGGVSWVEVILGEPTPLFWNFDEPKNFAADGPTPGQYLFSNGATGAVRREADGVPGQVKAGDVHWGIKFSPATPEVAAFHHVAPGSGAGGVGIESSTPASHFITFAGRLQVDPAETMNRLKQTLDLKNQPEMMLHALQHR